MVVWGEKGGKGQWKRERGVEGPWWIGETRGGGRKAYVVQTRAVVAVGDDLDGGVGAVLDAQIPGDGDRLPAEVAGAHLVHSGPEGDVEGVAGLVAQGEEDGDVVL